MANLFTATQRPDVGTATPSATKILGARDQERHRGPAFGEQLDNIARNRSDTAARERRDSIAKREQNDSRSSDSRTQSNGADDRAESRRIADRSESSADQAREAREPANDDTRSGNQDTNAQEHDRPGGDSGPNSEETASAEQSDAPAETSDNTGATTLLDVFAAAVETEATPVDAQTQESASLEQTAITMQSQTDPALLGSAAGITGASVAAQTSAFPAASTGLSHRSTQSGVAIPGLPLGQGAAPTDALGADPTTLGTGNESPDGDAAKQDIQGDRTFERTLAARNALAANENQGANGFQAASAARNGDLTAIDPTTLPIGATPQGQAGSSGTIIRMVPAATIGQAATVPVHTMAFHIARNVDNGVNRFEIRVDPPELGKIDVTMDVQSDGKVRVHMVVERAEALDFLQRDARALEKALSDAGLDADTDSVSFSLEHNEKEADGNHKDEFDAADNGDPGDDGESPGVPASGAQRQYLSTTAVDIRI